jgi:hypothetical protein
MRHSLGVPSPSVHNQNVDIQLVEITPRCALDWSNALGVILPLSKLDCVVTWTDAPVGTALANPRH